MKFFLGLVVFLSLLFVWSCSDDNVDQKGEQLEDIRLTDFPLFEVTHLSIKIDHPVIESGEEVEHGQIKITIPFSQQSLMLSLKQLSLDNNKYRISPSVAMQQDFSKGPVTYAILSTTSQVPLVHYDVTVVHGGDPFFVNAKVTGFKFEKTKNAQLDATIEAVKIQEYENFSENAIYVIVPAGTDFSDLTPTVTFDAAKLYYNNDTQFVLYPEGGVGVDFKYPKRFSLQAENSLGERSRPYKVIVDVKDPIRFDDPILSTPNVKAGDNTNSEDFFEIASWTNQGNHPITGMSPRKYDERNFPEGFPEEISVITGSLINPNGGGTPGVLPGEKGRVNAKVKRMSVTGAYSIRAVFQPTFSFDTGIISFWPEADRVEDIFEPAGLTIKTVIEE